MSREKKAYRLRKAKGKREVRGTIDVNVPVSRPTIQVGVLPAVQVLDISEAACTDIMLQESRQTALNSRVKSHHTFSIPITNNGAVVLCVIALLGCVVLCLVCMLLRQV
jgi:hypothetical protein